MEIMRRHPYYGYKLLKKIKFLEEEAAIVVSHHENYDGSGYPNGLHGDQIPLDSRIIHVVSDYDNMCHSNRFGNPLTPEDAQRQLIEKSGELYDPYIVEQYLSILESGNDGT